MKVLFISPSAGLGGAERCLLDCIEALNQQASTASEVLALSDGPLLEKARALGAKTQVIPAPRELALLGESGSSTESGGAALRLFSAVPSLVEFTRGLRGAIASATPDVVHTNGMKAHLLGGLLAPKRARLVVHLHDFVAARRASRWLIPALQRVRPGAVFMANSQAVARDFAAIAPHADVRTVYNVVDTEYFCEGLSEPNWIASLANLGRPDPQTASFGLVATYARWKGHGLFIAAAGIVKKARPDVPLRFYIVGGAIYETLGSQVNPAELVERARAAGLEGDFGLVPFQDDIARVYRSLDVVAHASTQPEPFGRTIIEAMASGRPVLVARAGGALELFQEGVNALGYEAGNAGMLAEAMMRTLDAHFRARLGADARHHAVAAFGRSRLITELLRVYTS